MDVPDDELVMVSALQHYLFCPRQCALIHVEGLWEENYLTATGKVLHERVDRKGAETRRDIHMATALRLFSRRLGIMGVADMVEFHRVDGTSVEESGPRTSGTTKLASAVEIPGRSGLWKPYPVEYKRGKPKSHRADEVQLCAQALCLEEMLGVNIPEGALFYGESRRRTVVVFDLELRALVEQTAEAVREMISSGTTPPPMLAKGCDACSVRALCRPDDCANGHSTRKWIDNQLDEVLP